MNYVSLYQERVADVQGKGRKGISRRLASGRTTRNAVYSDQFATEPSRVAAFACACSDAGRHECGRRNSKNHCCQETLKVRNEHADVLRAASLD